MTIEFHENAAARFNELAQELLTKVRAFPAVEPRSNGASLIHPMAQLSEKDVSGVIAWKQSSVNGFGEETGRYWDSSTGRMGYEAEEYAAVRNLAARLEQSEPLKDRVSLRFLLDELFTWLRETLEAKRTDTLTDFIAKRRSEAVKDHEFWIPVYRTYSSREFSMGPVQFRTISPAMLERWYSRIPEEQRKREPGVDIVLRRQRSALQGTLAACVVVEADPIKAAEAARTAADEAIALLRFLSEVNWTCRITSHCLPMGKENTRTTMDILVQNGEIRSIGKGVIEQGPAGWNVDEARRFPLTAGVLESLQELASQRTRVSSEPIFTGPCNYTPAHPLRQKLPISLFL